MFRKGETVRRNDGESFSNKEFTATIDSYRGGNSYWLLETGTHITVDLIHLVHPRAEHLNEPIVKILDDLKSQLGTKEIEVEKIKKAIKLLEEIY